MSKSTVITIIFSLIVGLGLGFSLGRNADPFKVGPQSMNQNTSKMSAELGKKDEEFDMRFIDEMIAHHEGAIDMAEQALQNSDRNEIKGMSNEIISAQSSEIQQLKQWKEQWYGNR